MNRIIQSWIVWSCGHLSWHIKITEPLFEEPKIWCTCVDDYLHEGSKRSGAEECEVIAPSWYHVILCCSIGPDTTSYCAHQLWEMVKRSRGWYDTSLSKQREKLSLSSKKRNPMLAANVLTWSDVRWIVKFQFQLWKLRFTRRLIWLLRIW